MSRSARDTGGIPRQKRWKSGQSGMAVRALIAESAIGVVCEALLVFPAASCCNPLRGLLEGEEQRLQQRQNRRDRRPDRLASLFLERTKMSPVMHV